MAMSWAVGEKAQRDRAHRVMGHAGGALSGESRGEGRNVSDKSMGSRATGGVEEADSSAETGVKNQIRRELLRLTTQAEVSRVELKALSTIVLCVVLTSILIAAGLRTGLPLLAIPAVIFAAMCWLRRAVFRRAERFERDYPSMLVALASSIRTGLDPIVALQQAAELFSQESELGKELRKFVDAINAGQGEELALRRFGETINHPDIPLFRTAFLLARKEGSSLAKCLHRLARVTRNRQSFRRRMRASIAMQKLSSIGIAGCALLIVLFQAVVNNKALYMATAHPLGFRMLVAAGILMMLGLVGMFRMTRARI